MSAAPDPLVPGRECGACNACCRLYEIPALGKPNNVLCDHWQGGCAIYETRPDACRAFFYVWRQNATLDDSWRPDRAGVVIRATFDGIPPHFALRQGLVLDLAGPGDAVTEPRLVQLVAGQIRRGVAVFLSVRGPLGFGAVKLLLNDRLAKSVAARDDAATAADLRATLAALRAA